MLMGATHGITQYDFLLISIVVIDDNGEGLPVAWAISNREDVTLLVEFLKAVHVRVGEIAYQYFMSDCAEQYYHAWCSVFGKQNTKKLLCRWHVDRAWRAGLNQQINSIQDRIEVYYQLCVLIEEREESKFLVRLQQFVSNVSDKYPNMCAYFKREYLPKC